MVTALQGACRQTPMPSVVNRPARCSVSSQSIRKILLPADCSQPAQGAARYASYLAGKFAAQLIVLHVEPYPLALPGFADHGATLGEWFVGRATESEIELRHCLTGLSHDSVRFVVLEGDPAARIVAYAKNEGIDLIVMPTHGEGPFRHLLLGSVVGQVLQEVGCPVWTGAHLADAPELNTIRVGKILCALGATPKDRIILQAAAGMAERLGAQLFAVHAIPPGRTGSDGSKGSRSRKALEAKIRARAKGRLGQLADLAEVAIAEGEIPQAVCGKAGELPADLIVIGRSTGSGIFGRLHANGYAIFRDSPCPILII